MISVLLYSLTWLPDAPKEHWAFATLIWIPSVLLYLEKKIGQNVDGVAERFDASGILLSQSSIFDAFITSTVWLGVNLCGDFDPLTTASKADKVEKHFKKDYPVYLPVKNPTFIDATRGCCVLLGLLIKPTFRRCLNLG